MMELTARHVMALSDGQYFLEHCGTLVRALDLEPYCRVCELAGLPASVALSGLEGDWQFRCTHAHGWIKRDTPLDLEPLLHALHWNLRCTRCHQPVEGNNVKTDASFLVSCVCQIRQMASPVATATSLH